MGEFLCPSSMIIFTWSIPIVVYGNFSPKPWNLMGAYTTILGRYLQRPMAFSPPERIGAIMCVHWAFVNVKAGRGHSIVRMILVVRAIHASCLERCPVLIFSLQSSARPRRYSTCSSLLPSSADLTPRDRCAAAGSRCVNVRQVPLRSLTVRVAGACSFNL